MVEVEGLVEGLNSTDDPQRRVVKGVFLTKSPSWIHNQSRAWNFYHLPGNLKSNKVFPFK